MCLKCSEAVAHLKSSFKVSLTPEEKASLPGKEWRGSINSLTEAQKEEKRAYRRSYERLYRKKQKDLGGLRLKYQKEYQLAYRKHHPELLQQRSKSNYENNKERYYASERKRRALEAKVYSERYTETEVLNRWGSNCHLCGGPIDLDAPRAAKNGQGWEKGLHLDHVVPISYGGPDILENVKPSHGICNLSRGKSVENIDTLLAGLDPKVSKTMYEPLRQKPPKLGRPLKD